MDAETILSTVRSGSVPEDWYVWPLRRDRVLRSAAGWLVTALVGFAFLIPVALATIPGNFRHGGLLLVFTIGLLGILAAVAFGGLAIAASDYRRAQRADEYLLIVTPDDFVKSEPSKTIYVPMASVAHVTVQGVRTPEQQRAREQDARPAAAQLGRLIGTNALGRDPKVSPSLAFEDTRDESRVVVATDDSFEDLNTLGQILSTYASGAERRPLA